jgi:cytochrome c oxidase cbb3-type subunit 4
MDYTAFIGSITTVTMFATFVGIVVWAYSRRRKPAFDAAAMEPFALPDERAGAAEGNAQRQGRT